MTILEFPPVEEADDDGLLAIGGDLDVGSLLLAYSHGIFPWPSGESKILPWFAPPNRAILRTSAFHLSRSLAKDLRKGGFTFTIDARFSDVILACAKSKNRPGQRGTWINRSMISAYTTLHEAGHAHSVECLQNGELVGGLYGVSIGQLFTGESMFHIVPNASKLALHHLIEHVAARGATWIDCQVPTPHLQSLGAETIPRNDFMLLLKRAIAATPPLFPPMR